MDTAQKIHPVQTSVASSRTPVDGSHIAIPVVNPIVQSGTPAVTPPVPQLAAQGYIVDINGLVPTKSIHFNIVVRVTTIWKMYDTQNKKDVKSLELSLIDAQGSKIQAIIPARIMKDFVKYFKNEGVCRRLSRFDHCLNINGGYHCSKHEYKIVFGSDTLVEQAVDLDIPNHVFEYTPFAEITNFVANFDYCCDLIGHIIGYSDPIVEKAKVSATTNLFNGWKMLTLSGISELDQGCNVVVAARTDNGKAILCPKKWMCSSHGPVSAEEQYKLTFIDIDPELSAQYYHSVNPNQDSNAKTAVSCTDETDLVLLGDDSAGSPPPKKFTIAHEGYITFEDFVSDAEMLTLSGISELDQGCNDVVFAKISGLAKENEWSYTGCSVCNRKVFEIEDAEKNNGGNKKPSFVKSRKTDNGKAILCPKKWMCSSHGPVSALKFKLQVYVLDGSGSRIATLWDRMLYNFINKSAAELIQEFTIAHEGEESVKSHPNKRGINPQYFRAIGWPLNQTVLLVLDDKHKQWNFNIYTQQGEPVGKLYFKLRVFNSEGYCCDQDISASDSSEGEVDTIDYIRSNSDQNTFNVVMNTDVIQRGRLVR
ncbi:OLC1v1031539C1 [Oldenlandia corymbosa var. corymbosa]|uniref:OLC1v1031539C1 n=1 Tax=Oldenlandia corymbosa var. corymbosa TaxID=529605 RepID=A0AAV1CJK1_OLDCO|nr:OLC1v1031539C1 [Oldenlandia corymbosa var. corymbosa]